MFHERGRRLRWMKSSVVLPACAGGSWNRDWRFAESRRRSPAELVQCIRGAVPEWSSAGPETIEEGGECGSRKGRVCLVPHEFSEADLFHQSSILVRPGRENGRNAARERGDPGVHARGNHRIAFTDESFQPARPIVPADRLEPRRSTGAFATRSPRPLDRRSRRTRG